MTAAQALAIAAAALVFVEPRLPARAFEEAATVAARIETHARRNWQDSVTIVGALPDGRCMGRGKLLM
jgi:hypothetical protein